jgi:CheY-like chemotaxis protein
LWNVEMTEPHILVVDDHRDVREPLAAYLRKRGMRVSLAADVVAARASPREAVDRPDHARHHDAR